MGMTEELKLTIFYLQMGKMCKTVEKGLPESLI